MALEHLPRQIDGIDEIETLIINDGSSDGTVAEARRLGVNHIVSFKRNKGLARGFMAGWTPACILGRTSSSTPTRTTSIMARTSPSLSARSLKGKPTL